jgi:hypothetical protein
MILIEPTKYTKRLLGKSWRKVNGRFYDRSEHRSLFFRKLTTNTLCRARIGDDYYRAWNPETKEYIYGGRMYASDKMCIVGIGMNAEEAKTFGMEHNDKFKNFHRTSTEKPENVEHAIYNSRSYRP